MCGYFPNSFSRSQLLLDGQRLNVPVAGSTDMVMFTPQNLVPGKHVISWNIPAFDSILNPDPKRARPSPSERIEFEVLAVQASIDQNKLLSGDETDLRMRIIGTADKLQIELENTTPDVIDLAGGAKQIAETEGGKNNVLKRKVKAKKTGMLEAPFNINYRLALPPCPCKPEEIENLKSIGGQVTTPPEDSAANRNQPRRDCEEILSQYNALSVEYAKLQTDLKRAMESCDRFDDGTIAGRNNRDACRRAIAVANLRAVSTAAQLRERMLELLAAYRACTSGP